MSDAIAKVKMSHIALIYSVFPMLLLFIGIDTFFLGKKFFWWAPSSPEVWMFWVMAFGMPHVLGSLHAFADKEYLNHYGKWKSLGFCAMIAAGTLLLYWINPKLLFLFFMFSIVHHTVAQQFGLAMMTLRTGPSALFKVWKWSAVACGMVIYYIIYKAPGLTLHYPLGITLQVDHMNPRLLDLAYTTYAVSFAAGVALLVQSMRKHQLSRVSVAYTVGTILVCGFFLLYMRLGYYILIIVASRLMHEGCAWIIYLTHDSNRQKARSSNVIYRSLAFTRIPVPVLSLLLAYGLGMYIGWWYFTTGWVFAYLLTTFLSILHYYMEAYIWRKESIHRKYLAFAT